MKVIEYLEMTTFLQKLVAEVEAGQSAFTIVNSRLADICKSVIPVEALSPSSRYTIAEGVWVDFDLNADVDARLGSEGDGLRIETTSVGNSPWFSFTYELPVDGLSGARYLGQALQCSSRGSVRFRLCLRYLLEDGFKDVFYPRMVVMTGGKYEDFLFVRVDQELASAATGVEVLFFFEGRAFDFSLEALENISI